MNDFIDKIIYLCWSQCLLSAATSAEYSVFNFSPIIAVTAVNVSGIGRGDDISGEHSGTSRYVQF